jgi:two-component system chemotaxis sensor kinase CheA
VHSSVGQGTTVRIRIPLTLAIIKVLVVTSAGDRYAIPQVSIVELVRVDMGFWSIATGIACCPW